MVATKRISDPIRGEGMTTLTFTDDPRGIARILESRRKGGRTALARDLGCAPGTLENLQRDRLKDVRKGWVRQKLEALLVREIEAEIRRLTHELEVFRLAGGDVASSPKLVGLVAAVEAAQRLISHAGGAR